MAILSSLLTVAEPNGMWEIIIKAFEGFTNNYILAIILLTIIIRLVWAPIDTFNKRISQKTTANQQKMMPELNKLKEKYAANPQLFKQKQNELYKKYNSNTMGSCLFMLVFMALNLTIFLTLWTGLNNMAAFKINQSYEQLKYDYANCLVLADKYVKTLESASAVDFENTEIVLKTSEDGQKTLELKEIDGQTKESVDFLSAEDFSEKYLDGKELGENETVETTSNQYIVNLIQQYIKEDDELGAAIQKVAMEFINQQYDSTKEGFLWIDNIWVADSPFEKSIFSYNSYEAKVGASRIDREEIVIGQTEESEDIKIGREEFIYNSFMQELQQSDKNKVNGYFILPILCVAVTFLSMWLTTRKKKGQEVAPQPGGKAMKIIMPLIFGVFAILYNSVFAIYLLMGQIISTALMPLQNLILEKWQAHIDKKKKEAEVEVIDYRRKF